MSDRHNDGKFHLDALGEAYKLWRAYGDEMAVAVCTFEEFIEGWRYHEPNMVSGSNGDQSVSIFWRPDGPIVQIADTLNVRQWRPSDKPEQAQNDKLDLFGMMRSLMTEAQKQNVQLALISERLDNMALDFTNFNTALAGIAADSAQASIDIAAILAVLAGASGTSPADQASIDAATAALTAVKGVMDANAVAIEAKIPSVTVAAPIVAAATVVAPATVAPVVSAPVAAALATAPAPVASATS